MNLKSKLGIGSLVGLAHFASYFMCISAVVANDANGEPNSSLLGFTVAVLGLPLMGIAATVRHVLAGIGFSERGLFAGELAVAGLNASIWAGAFIVAMNFVCRRIKSSNHSPGPAPGAVH